MWHPLDRIDRDIAWFFIDQVGNIGFCTSGGGELPSSVVDLYASGELSLMLKYFLALTETSSVVYGKEVELSPSVLQRGVGSVPFKEWYDMSIRGLYSFDCLDATYSNDPSYKLITSPALPINIENISNKIRSSLEKVILPRSIKSIQEFRAIEFG